MDTANTLAARALKAPREVLRDGLALLAAGPEDAAVAILHLAVAIAAIEVHEIDQADQHARAAVSAASGSTSGPQDPATLARCESVLAWVHALRGDVADAVALGHRALPHLHGSDRARTLMRIGLAEQRLGRHDDALATYAQAEPALRAADEPVVLARLLLNRGALHTYLGRTADAVADLHGGRDLGQSLGQDLAATLCAQNLGFALGRAGDLVAALGWFHTAGQELAGLPDVQTRLADLDLDTAEVLAAAGLLAEARARAGAAARVLAEAGQLTDHAEAVLLQSRLALAAGEPADAVALAGQARALLAGQGRTGWALQAETVGLLAEVELGTRTRELQWRQQVLARCDALEAEGWEAEADDARSSLGLAILGDSALDPSGPGRSGAGSLVSAHEDVRRLLASSTSDHPLTAARWQHVRARLAMVEGDRQAARTHLSGGLALLESARARLGSSELQAHWAVHAQRLVIDAATLALSDGDAWAVLLAVEAWRARSVAGPAVRPPPDRELAGLLTRLRGVEAELLRVRSDQADAAGLLARRAELEAAVSARTRTRSGPAGAAHPAQAAPPEAALRERVAAASLHDGNILLSYMVLGGRVHAVSVVDGDPVLHRDLATTDELGPLIDRVTFALRRLGLPGGSPASVTASIDGLATRARQLDDLLLRPCLVGLDPARRVQLVPAGVLHGLPWTALPSARQRRAAVLPTLAMAAAAATVVPQGTLVALVAGPDLPGAREEVTALQALHGPARSRLLVDGQATVAATLAALDGAGVGHIAAHGTFRNDNAQFSSLRLADGPLTVHEMEGITRPPPVVVLPACDSGRSQLTAGEDLLGTAAALLRAGVGAVVAPLVPIPDEATVPLMAGLHRALSDGCDPAAALHQAITEGEAAAVALPADLDGAAAVVRAAFVSLGW